MCVAVGMGGCWWVCLFVCAFIIIIITTVVESDFIALKVHVLIFFLEKKVTKTQQKRVWVFERIVR